MWVIWSCCIHLLILIVDSEVILLTGKMSYSSLWKLVGADPMCKQNRGSAVSSNVDVEILVSLYPLGMA